MSSITINDLPKDLTEALRYQAERNNLSIESEARRILLEGVVPLPKRRELGKLRSVFGSLPDPTDGWGPMSDDEVALWERSE